MDANDAAAVRLALDKAFLHYGGAGKIIIEAQVLRELMEFLQEHEDCIPEAEWQEMHNEKLENENKFEELEEQKEDAEQDVKAFRELIIETLSSSATSRDFMERALEALGELTPDERKAINGRVTPKSRKKTGASSRSRGRSRRSP